MSASQTPPVQPVRQLTEIGRALLAASSEARVTEIVAQGCLRLGLGAGALAVARDMASERPVLRHVGVSRGAVRALEEAEDSLGARWAALQAVEPTVRLAPLSTDGEVTGLIAVFSDEAEPGPFQQWVLASLADHASVALDQLRLDREATEAEERMQTLEHSVEGGLRAMAAFSHDARSPLQSIRMGVQLLRDGTLGPVEGKQVEVLERMKRAVGHVDEMFERLMETAELVAGNMSLGQEPLSLGALWREALNIGSPRAEAARLRVSSKVSDAPDVLGDALRVRQILLNLLDNASKYAAPGRLEVWTEATEDAVELHLSDDGPGVRPEDAERIFAVFGRGKIRGARKKGEGFGLGLGVSRSLAEAMDGDLRLEEGGDGAHFVLSLPRG